MSHQRCESIEHYMTSDPVCIDAAASMAEASDRMLRLGCRHLPLLSAGKLVGVVSLRGLYRLETRDSLARATRPVYDALEEPFVVIRGMPVTEVAARMAAGRWEAAIVVEEGRVVGIFTEADALRALVTIASRQSRPALTTA